jgi:hypothetical protein
MDKRFIYLHDVPWFGQGSQDMACGYACTLMMLVALEGATFYEEYYLKVHRKLEDLFGTCGPYQPGADPHEIRKILGDHVHAWRPIGENVSSEVRRDLVAGLEEGRPSMLLLPCSVLQPYGHYVVVKGYANCIRPKRTGPGEVPIEQFFINDPLVGEITIAADESAFASLLGQHGSVLIASKPTLLRRS